MPNGYFCYIEKNIYCVNRYLLLRDHLPYRIDVDKYVNKLIIDGKYSTGVVNDYNMAVFNYDCTGMNWRQFVDKQRGWFSAYYKYAGNLDHFKLTMRTVLDDHELYRYVVKRVIDRIKWGLKKGRLFKKGIEFNPVIVQDSIANLTKEQYGKNYFGNTEIDDLLV